jgi:hypothetical protein
MTILTLYRLQLRLLSRLEEIYIYYSTYNRLKRTMLLLCEEKKCVERSEEQREEEERT